MGVLDGVKVIEVAGIGPGPFAAMMLADMGADGLRVDRPAGGRGLSIGNASKDVLARGRRSVALDLKSPEGLEVLLDLVESSVAVCVLQEGLGTGAVDVAHAQGQGGVLGGHALMVPLDDALAIGHPSEASPCT